MAQQMVNGSYYDGDVTITVRQSARYAVVNPPLSGKHKKPQTKAYKNSRKYRNAVKGKTILHGVLRKKV